MKQKPTKKPYKKEPVKETVLPPIVEARPFSLTGFRMQALVLAFIGLLFYANSFNNEYAFDDGIVILKNDYVQDGFGGIGKILTRDSYDSFYKQRNASQQFSGGRYRPLSAITFAIEQELFGSNAEVKPENDVAYIRHIVNVLLYIFSVIVLLYFLHNYIFKKKPLLAFIACLLFLIHPLHTEVVANVKSRDEILSFLFIILTFIGALRYRDTKKKSHLLYGLLFYFLALLSKEYAVTLIVLIPVLFYTARRDSLQKSLMATLPFLLVAAGYIAMRISFVGIGTTGENPDVLNNPYKFATDPQKLATKMEVLLYYIRLLFYPQPLSYDYSYNTFPYVNFGNGVVWLSLIIHLSMIVAAVVLFVKRNVLSFAIVFYFLHLMMVSNFVLDVGATMGERLVYHSLLGFVILLAVFIAAAASKIKSTGTRTIVLAAIGIIVVAWSGIKVIKRNAEWKNDPTLYLADVHKVPNSALANGNAGMVYYNFSIDTTKKEQKKELTDKAIYHLEKSVSIHPAYVNGYLNLGVVYLNLKDFDKAKYYWDIVKQIYPNNPILRTNYDALAANYFNKAMTVGNARIAEAVAYLEKAVEVAPHNPEYWYNLGGAAFTIQDFAKARMAFTKALEINPGHVEARKGMEALQLIGK